MTKFLNISTDTTLGGSSASDDTVSSQKAIKAYVDSQTGTAPAFANITGQPTDNANLASALNAKYDASNPNGYTSNVGTVTSVNNTSPDSGGNVTLSIPTVNNATLTIQKNGTTVNTFTANASSDVTANITVPTKTSDLTNDDGFITGITSSDVTTALGYTPYDSSNPSGYTSNTGTVTSVNNVSPVSGNVTLSIPTVNDATLTITQGGTTKGTFTANASGDVTIALDAGGASILEALYPVGSVYITTANTCPLSTLISGSTWELVSSGRVLQGTDSGHSAGTTIEAGLPNITGTVQNIRTSFVGEHTDLGTGAIRLTSTAKNGPTNGTATQNDNLIIDASLSSSIYGNSSTVQPPAYVVNIWQRTA